MSMSTTENIDEGLYSRQLFVLGKEAMRSLGESHILLVGLGGLGVEIAKDLILAGVRSLTLLDDTMVSWGDFSGNFYFKDADVGTRTRAEASFSKLAELNSYVHLKLHPKSQHEDQCDTDNCWPINSNALKNDEFLMTFQVVVLTECGHDHAFLTRFSEKCHSLGVKLIVANTYGVFGQVFCDLGDVFVVKDALGEDTTSFPIGSIEEVDGDTLIHLMDRHFYRLMEGDSIVFSGIQGMTELNGQTRVIQRIVDTHTLSIGSTQGMSPYISGGTVTEAKVQKEMHFSQYSMSWSSGPFLSMDLAKNGVQHLKLHLLFRALSDFYLTHGRSPFSWDEDDATLFENYVEPLVVEGMEGREVESTLRRQFAYTCRGSIVPMQAVIGGFAAQEAVKACTGKFTPLHQWMYIDAVECLPEHVPTKETKVTHCHPRYTGQIQVIGEVMQQRLHEMNWFMVGAGAIGCEMLKNFAMMGVACDDGQGVPSSASGDTDVKRSKIGCITVTDMDSIERSNLNRQFLFRNHNIGQNKAIVAARAVKEMNPQLSIVAHQNKVGPATEVFYTDTFYRGLDGLANALDNVEARQYMDERSHYFGLPLLESGTQGTRGHTQMIMPHVTSGYEAPHDARNAKFAICTLKSFPYLIQHTIQWARDLFEGLFVQTSALARRFIEDRESLLSQLSTLPCHEALESLRKVQTTLASPSRSELECVQWARALWAEHYHNNILQLLFNYPPDYHIDGLAFWTVDKRMPHALDFDPTQALHMDFIQAAASLRAFMFGIAHRFEDREYLRECVQQVTVPQFNVNTQLHIAANDKEEEQMRKSQMTSVMDQVQRIKEELLALKLPGDFVLNMVEFEKDDDTNHHIDFMTAASNLRAVNYDIEPVDRLKTKGIAGRIIPAIATTTAIITGLICLEVYKMINGHNDTEKYREVNVELANPSILILYSQKPRNLENTNYTEWSLFRDPALRNMTLREFMEHFEKNHNCPLDAVLHGNTLLYSKMLSSENEDPVLNMEMKALLEHVQQKPVENHAHSIPFNLISSLDDVDVLPKAIYIVN